MFWVCVSLFDQMSGRNYLCDIRASVSLVCVCVCVSVYACLYVFMCVRVHT